MQRIALGLALAGCAAVRPAPLDDEARNRPRLAQWVEQFNSGDYPGAATIWAPDLIGVIPGGPDDSFDREMAGAQKAQRSPVRFFLTVDEVLVDGDLAVVRD